MAARPKLVDRRAVVAASARTWGHAWAVQRQIERAIDCLVEDARHLEANDTTSQGSGSLGSITERMAMMPADEALRDARKLAELVAQADTALAHAMIIIERTITIPDCQGADHPEYWCLNCAGHGFGTVPIHRGLRICKWCYDWRIHPDHAMQLPPKEFVVAHHEGKRITPKLYASVMATIDRSKRKPSKSKKRTTAARYSAAQTAAALEAARDRLGVQ